ncbi:MAG TPA: tetratricopeptide repeat-containing protein [Solirubrobacteraceae bacterium]
MSAFADSVAPRTPSQWLDAVRDAERRGELLTAFDLAERGLAEHPGDVSLEHRAVLALARAGSTEEAARRFADYRLQLVDDEDVAALGARLEKDVALATGGDGRAEHAARAAALYDSIFARTGGYYPAINAATLSLIAGRRDDARRLAGRVLEAIGGERSYYAAATEAEAQLLLGRVDFARAALERAAALHDGDHAAVATTRRQLRLVCGALGVDDDVLAALPPPLVVHFCGHRISADGRFTAAVEDRAEAEIADVVDGHPPAYAYGSLASGGDIMWAEALLGRGAELHAVLPCARDEFVAHSVATAGPSWSARFDRCLRAAAAVSYATDDAFLGDDVLYRYAAELAMGLALLRAGYLEAEVRQLALWDGGPALGAAGTAIDIAAWQRRGGATTVVWPGEPAPGGAPASAPPAGSGREVRALLFADVKGFSRLTDEQVPVFVERALGPLGAVLDRYGDHVCHRNSWGDGIYVVLRDAALAAACALDLQAAMAGVDLEAAGLPGDLALRLGAHVGPVFELHDPVTHGPSFHGTHVSRTARIEPVTPPGVVYVTEAFAAALVLQGSDELACDYVGHMPAAKDFGRLRMYRLRRRR